MERAIVQVFYILLISGLLCVALEIFVPGGVLGVLGGAALVAASITSFMAFGQVAGSYITIAIMLAVGAVLLLWVKYFPKTAIGRQMTVCADLSDAKATEPWLADLAGQTGTTVSTLRPSGFAKINGRRTDVVTRGEMIEKGQPVRVLEIEGNRVVVTLDTPDN